MWRCSRLRCVLKFKLFRSIARVPSLPVRWRFGGKHFLYDRQLSVWNVPTRLPANLLYRAQQLASVRRKLTKAATVLRCRSNPYQVQRWTFFAPTNDQNSSSSRSWMRRSGICSGAAAAVSRIVFKTVFGLNSQKRAVSRMPAPLSVMGTISSRIVLAHPR